MAIKLLHTADCHAWEQASVILEEALKEAGLNLSFETVLVETEQQAKEERFLGSPTILVDGLDVDPLARDRKAYSLSSCRPYFYQGKFSDFPPKEMILEALRSKK